MSIEAINSTREKPSANLKIKMVLDIREDSIPPKDAKDVGDKQYKADKRGETLGIAFSPHCETLNQVANVWSQYHS
jgi:hypothetical protein